MLNKLIPTAFKKRIKDYLCKHSLWISQAGQDFWVYGECFNFKRNGFFIDIGAHDGKHISNTLILEKALNWDGLCIEANPHTFEQLRKNRRCRSINIALAEKEGEALFKLDGVTGGLIGDSFDNKHDTDSKCIVVKTMPLSVLLDVETTPDTIDYISVDVEGAEDVVFSGLDLYRHRANVLTIERPSVALREKLAKFGYILIKDIPDLDAFFIHESFKTDYTKNFFEFWERRFLRFQWTSHR